MCKFEDVPVFILIHLGGNDIGRIGLKDLRKKYKDEIDWVQNPEYNYKSMIKFNDTHNINDTLSKL
jgi:lysophospholipase L1-like esterase